MKRRQSGQAVVEWTVVAFVLLLFALGLLALGQIVGQYMAVRSAASQAAFAAARAPSQPAAIQVGDQAAREAIHGSQVTSFAVRIATGTFERGATLTATAEGYVSLAPFPIVSQILGQRFHIQWQASALIEPYRSRSP
jgi:Flp pilus assembly protein TadG